MSLIARLRSCSALIQSALILLCSLSWTFGHQANLPPLAKIKSAAEGGDPSAQDRLGETYLGGFNFSQAEHWFRKAAEGAVANAQWQLGMIYLTGKPKMQGERAVPQDEREAIRWLSKAANQGNVRAQLDLGHCYANGKAVQKDLVEAYKWYSLAAKQDAIWGKMHREPLILKMTSDQIAEGQRRFAGFRTSRDNEVQLPSPPEITLQGIARFKDHRQAVINGRTFGVGDEREILAGGKKVKVRCIEIRADSVLLQVGQGAGSSELRLRGNK